MGPPSSSLIAPAMMSATGAERINPQPASRMSSNRLAPDTCASDFVVRRENRVDHAVDGKHRSGTLGRGRAHLLPFHKIAQQAFDGVAQGNRVMGWNHEACFSVHVDP